MTKQRTTTKYQWDSEQLMDKIMQAQKDLGIMMLLLMKKTNADTMKQSMELFSHLDPKERYETKTVVRKIKHPKKI